MKQVFFALVIVLLTGCGVQKDYDLSETIPFSAYSNAEAILKRDVWLVDYVGYAVIYPDDYIGSRIKDREIIPIKAGTPVHVCRTYLFYENQGFLQADFTTCDLVTWIRIEPAASGMQDVIYAQFNDWTEEFVLGVKEGHLKQPIRPAPWEPLGNIERTIGWPDEKYRIKMKYPGIPE